MSRPNIPDQLVEEVEEIHKEHRDYEANTVQEALATVTDVAKQSSEEISTEETRTYDIEDPIQRAIKAGMTSPSDLTSPDGTPTSPLSLLGIQLAREPRHSAGKGVINAQKAIKSIRQREDEGEITTHTADQLVKTYRKALEIHIDAKQDQRERDDEDFQGANDLKDAIDEFLHENYIEEEFERKTGFTDFDIGIEGLFELMVLHLDQNESEISTEPLDKSTLPEN
ncbi:hypothetical protein [Salarchaeum sp. JOR-1]|uniref:hypothetical protein n=1 Tax=Salarchaeum sp. JOR-1 TaxID=2599399 RepID=UPI0011982C56|nr:hypothetical protein [Salarchaeum sp. JOR-1]QDX40856.1 hypothetical protein FQU85_08060 [Salarchaeum sp. JOR-1]